MSDIYVTAAYSVSLGLIFVYWCVIHLEARFLQRKESGIMKKTKEDD